MPKTAIKQRVQCVEPLEETRQNAIRQAMDASRHLDAETALCWLAVAAEARRQQLGM